MRAPRTDTQALFWLALAVLIGYANVLNGAFQFDDHNVIVNEAQVHSWAGWFGSLGSGIRPLLKFSYTLNWTLGPDVFGFHLVNLLIHLANAYLVYRLAQAFTRQQWQRENLRPAPLLTALLFALHPAQTEAVSYLCGRSASLMALFYLGALLCYVTGRTRDSRFYLYVATPLLFALALAVKETAITFPLALLLWETVCGKRWQSSFSPDSSIGSNPSQPPLIRGGAGPALPLTRGSWRGFGFKPQWPVWVVTVIAVLVFIFSNSYFAQMQRSAEFNSLSGNFATQLIGFAWLLRQWIMPLWLNIDPDLPLHTSFSGALLPLILFMALFATMLACRRSRPWLAFALAWTMLHLIPLYLFLPRLDIANERQLYLAAWPLLLALSIELSLHLNSMALRLTALALLLVFASLTVMRNQVYTNEIALWQDTAMKSPNKARVHNNLGHAYLLEQRYDEARREFTTALRLNPDLYQARYNLYRTDEEIEKAGGALRP